MFLFHSLPLLALASVQYKAAVQGRRSGFGTWKKKEDRYKHTLFKSATKLRICVCIQVGLQGRGRAVLMCSQDVWLYAYQLMSARVGIWQAVRSDKVTNHEKCEVMESRYS